MNFAIQGTASYKSKVYQFEIVHPTGVVDVTLREGQPRWAVVAATTIG